MLYAWNSIECERFDDHKVDKLNEWDWVLGAVEYGRNQIHGTQYPINSSFFYSPILSFTIIAIRISTTQNAEHFCW